MKKFELAEQKEVNKLDPYVDRVINALGHKEAIVTDESYVSDFLSFIHHEPLRTKIRGQELKKAIKKLGMEFNELELVINVAKRLLKHEKQRKNA